MIQKNFIQRTKSSIFFGNVINNLTILVYVSFAKVDTLDHDQETAE